MSGRLLTDRDELLPIRPLRTFNLETEGKPFILWQWSGVSKYIVRKYKIQNKIWLCLTLYFYGHQ